MTFKLFLVLQMMLCDHKFSWVELCFKFKRLCASAVQSVSYAVWRLPLQTWSNAAAELLNFICACVLSSSTQWGNPRTRWFPPAEMPSKATTSTHSSGSWGPAQRRPEVLNGQIRLCSIFDPVCLKSRRWATSHRRGQFLRRSLKQFSIFWIFREARQPGGSSVTLCAWQSPRD